MVKIAYQKYIKIFSIVGYAPPIGKQFQINGLAEIRPTIREEDDQGHVVSEAVCTSPVI